MISIRNFRKKLGLILVVIGIIILFLPFIKIELNKKEMENTIVIWNKKDKIQENNKKKNCTDETFTINNKDYVGVMIVDKTGEEIPILKGASQENLKYGAGLYDNDIFPGKDGTAIIFGHRETTFGFLEDIEVKDKIEIKTINNQYKYEVLETYVTNPKDASIISQDKGKRLRIVTCYPFNYLGSAPNRFVVNLKQIG